MNIIRDTNIQLQNGPTNAMKLLLEVYGIPRNFLEENDQLIKSNSLILNFFRFSYFFKFLKTKIKFLLEKNKIQIQS